MSDRPADSARQVLRDFAKRSEVTYPPPRPGDKPRRPMSETKKVYLAGKISKNDWRHDLVDLRTGRPLDRPLDPHFAQFKNTDLLTYVGPYFASCDHGCAHNNFRHAVGMDDGGFLSDCAEAGHNERDDLIHQKLVHTRSLEMIDQSDIVIAVIDDDAHGTIFEVGYAIAKGKRVILVSGKAYKEAWFPMANKDSIRAYSIEDAIETASNYASYSNKHKRCVSPIEVSFLNEAFRVYKLQTFDVNVPVMNGKYRIDFADVERKIAIELDGHAFHSDKATFENDRIRERELEEDGWRVLRFAGTEVHHDVAKAVQDAVRWIEKVAA